MDLDAKLGHRVTLNGTAFDAHAGAVLVLRDETVVYVDDLPAWDEEWAGRAVTLTGTLDRAPLGPEPGRTVAGGHTHGRSGRPYVVRNASWQATEA